MGISKTSYVKGSKPPADRAPRGKGKRVMMIDAIRATCKDGDEMEYIQKVIDASLGDPSADPPIPANPQLMTLVLNRIEPPMKSLMPMVNFDFKKGSSIAEQASQVMYAASKGKITPDVASMFISSLSGFVKIVEFTEMVSRMEAIEKSMGESS